ncbi:MAG: hypothetical protein AVDCRST_MAG88-3397, partial [uncultured Thermomicrobiales bacterium]
RRRPHRQRVHEQRGVRDSGDPGRGRQRQREEPPVVLQPGDPAGRPSDPHHHRPRARRPAPVRLRHPPPRALRPAAPQKCGGL